MGRNTHAAPGWHTPSTRLDSVETVKVKKGEFSLDNLGTISFRRPTLLHRFSRPLKAEPPKKVGVK
jgi:hypothetical protein